MTDDDDTPALTGKWEDVDIDITLVSGCCNHVLDAEDAPGYDVQESPGSRRGQNFVVGNGERIRNEGQVRLRMETEKDGNPTAVQSVFQVAEVSRPLMSVYKICDQGYKCVFDSAGVDVMDKNGKAICHFTRSNGLYVSTMKLKAPFHRQAP